MAKDKKGGGKKAAAAAPVAATTGASNGKSGGASGGAATTDANAAQKATHKQLKLDCTKAFGSYKKGNVKAGTKEVEKLLKLHLKHPLPHYAHVRISHKMALEQKQEASLKKQFKECHDRAAAALKACPDSLLIKLLFAQVCYDNPFLTEDQRGAMKDATGAAHRPAAGAGASADLKHAKAIATFDEDIKELPLFPDIRECGTDGRMFASEVGLCTAVYSCRMQLEPVA